MQTLLISILTILGSGVASAYITYRLNSKDARRLFELQKIEELYYSWDKFCTMLFNEFNTWWPVMEGKLTYDQANEISNKRGEKYSGKEFQQAEMIVMVYFQELEESLKGIVEIREALGDAVGPFKAEYRKNGPQESYIKFVPALRSALLRIDPVDNEFKKKLFAIARLVQTGKRKRIK